MANGSEYAPVARPSPLDLLPEGFLVPAIALQQDRSSYFRQIKDSVLDRPPSWHGHVFATLFDQNRVPTTVAFGPAPLTAEAAKSPSADLPRSGPANGIKTIFREVAELTKRSPGIVIDESARYHDAALIKSLTLDQFRDVKDVINTWKENPPLYRAFGHEARNCVVFINTVLEAAKIKVPKLWKIVPWPAVVGLTLELGSMMPTRHPSMTFVPARETLQRYNALLHADNSLQPH